MPSASRKDDGAAKTSSSITAAPKVKKNAPKKPKASKKS
jgi:hypothetical protein